MTQSWGQAADAAPKPFTEDELIEIDWSRKYFWYFLHAIFIKSFEGLTYENDAGESIPFGFSAVHTEWALLAQFNPRMCVMAPRAHLKTTVLALGYAFWLMFRADNELMDILYFSYKQQLAAEKVTELRRLIGGNSYCRFWRDQKGTAETIIDYLIDWGDGPVAEATLRGEGILSATRGRHPKVTIADDILSDFANPLGAVELNRINRVFRQAIMALPANPSDPLLVVGTPQSYDDVLYSLAASDDWLWLIYPAIKDFEEQRVQWPEKFTFERLMAIRKERGVTAFEVEYMLTPVLVTQQFLSREDVLRRVDGELKPWNLSEEFTNLDRLGTYGGCDVGKMVHPSHIAVFIELPSGTLIQLYQAFLDHLNYTEQIKRLNLVAERFNLTRGYYDSTFNVLDDRGLSRRWTGKIFTKKLKGDLATGLEKRIFAEAEESGIIFLNHKRMIDQMLVVDQLLGAVETPDGHGDSFWSIGLAVRAADDGPTVVDMSRPVQQKSASARETWLKQLGVTGVS